MSSARMDHQDPNCVVNDYEEHRLRVFEKKLLRGIFRPRREDVQEVGENCIMRSFITCAFDQILLS
jgi:hypothetical protein